MTAVDEFILYFPYILLSMALVIVLIERVFIRIFKAGHKLESFYELVVKDILDDEDEDNEKNKEAEQSNAKTTVELTQSFSDGANFYYSYLLRTSLEILTALYLFQWLLFHGIPSLSKDQLIYCDVHGYQYECAGLPQQFYTYILLVVLVILVMYLACSFYNFLWLVHPHMGCLAKVMDDYKHGMNQEYLESLNALYYNNRDLKLLFDLLAQSSGVSLSIKILSLFDKQFRQKFQPNLLKFNKDCINNKCVLQVEEQESYKTMSSLINKGAVVYTIELLPPVSKCPVATLTFNKDKVNVFNAQLRSFQISIICYLFQDVCKEVVFEDIDASITYKIRVTTNMNGKAVARKTYASTSTLEHEKEE